MAVIITDHEQPETTSPDFSGLALAFVLFVMIFLLFGL